jgi:2-oxoisovalerate dehydrogenase E1 component
VTRPRAAANETALTLAVRAAREALEREDLSVVDLDAVICSTTTPLDISPSLACRTLHGLCCGKTVHEIPAYDISAACSGYLYALACAFGFLRSHPQAKVLVVTTEVLSRVVDPSDFDTAILFGDAASATLLGGRPEDFTAQARLLCPVLSASGEDGSTLRVPAPGCGFVEMNGRRIFTQAVRKMVDMLRRACSESAMDLHDLSLIVPHQANSRIIEAIRERLGMGEDRVVNNIARYGNTSSTSIPLALAEVLGDRRPGEKIGLTAFGAGYTYGAAILEVDRGNGGTSPS